MNLKRALSISRPRFWIYELGSFILGFAAVAHAGDYSWHSLPFIIFSVYFTFPANIFIYGINDIFDYETDKLNPKKIAYESLVAREEHTSLWRWIILSSLVFIIVLFFVTISRATLLSLIAFLFFAGFYSSKPIRAKAKPFLDSLFSAGHYIATAVVGYYVAGGIGFPLIPLVGGMAWAIAMHAYSAVPDIKADTDAHLHTIATYLGAQKTLVLCLFLYTISSFVAYRYFSLFGIGGFIIYTSLMILSLRSKTSDELFTLYTYFPKINTLVGMILFFLVLLAK